jgi:hypothetical protein
MSQSWAEGMNNTAASDDEVEWEEKGVFWQGGRVWTGMLQLKSEEG